jgi:hypothetical protein
MKRPGSSLSRLKQQQQNIGLHTMKKKQEQEIPTKEEFIKSRDFQSAIIILEQDKL